MWMDALDTFVGLITVFLVLSLIVSALGEGISGRLNLKGKVLRQGVERLLDTAMADAFFDHPAIARLRPPGTIRQRLPSYVPDKVFAEVLLDLCINPPATDSSTQPRAELPVTPSTLDRALRDLDTPYATALRDLWRRADFDTEQMELLIAEWFNRTGDRSTGWFRRQLNLQLFLIGLVVAICLNADTIYMYQVLSKDAALREATTELAQQFADNVEQKGVGCTDQACERLVERFIADPANVVVDTQRALVASLCGQSVAALDAVSCAADLKARRSVEQIACDTMGVVGECSPQGLISAAVPKVLPLLGPDILGEQIAGAGNLALFWLLKAIGLVLTAAAVSLGAPFWFDLLQKVVQIRNSVKPLVSPAPAAADDAADTPAAAVAPRRRSAIPSGSANRDDLEGLTGFEHRVFGFSPLNLFWSARLARLAYVRDKQQVAEELRQWGAQGTLIGVTDTQCVVASTPRAVFIAFRGTEKKLGDWLTNVDVKLVGPAWDDNAAYLVHQGFDKALDDAWPAIMVELDHQAVFQRGLPIWLIGHSLGGALAALAALRLAHEMNADGHANVIGAVHTFGQPRVGDEACAQALERMLPSRYFRSINQRDIVPRIPLATTPDIVGKLKEMNSDLPVYEYRHAGRVVYFNDAGTALMDPPLWYRGLDTLAVGLTSGEIKEALGETLGDHDVDAYLRLHRELIQVSNPVATDPGEGA